MEQIRKSRLLDKLEVVVDRVVYHQDRANLPEDQSHAFIYFITIHNHSSHTVTLWGRKWILEYENGAVQVVEGDRIVGLAPTIAPGRTFSYNSYHITGMNARAHGAFHGQDDAGNLIYTPIPLFDMMIPSDA